MICHDPNLVAPIRPRSRFSEYPPSVVTLTPFSCENCHWNQSVVVQKDRDLLGNYFPPADPEDEDTGHPSTYDHFDGAGEFVGDYEYSVEILDNHDTHHMGFKGNVAAQCWKCHGHDPNEPGWDPYDSELIRYCYCETCHDLSTLHTIRTHVGPLGMSGGPAAEGWEAAGFHTPGSTSGIPTVYRGNRLIIFGGNPSEYFEAIEMCFGCHGDNVPPMCCGSLLVPVLGGVSPNAVRPTGSIELHGVNFGDVRTPGEDGVYLKGPSTGGTWQADVGVA